MNRSLISAPELITSHWFNTPEPIWLSGLLGKVVVIEAFQMLCPGCVSHGLPQTTRVRQTFSKEDVMVLGLHTVFEHHEAQGSKAALKAFLREYRIEFPVAIDAQSTNTDSTDLQLPQTMQKYQLRGTPSLILIDREGYCRERYFGNVTDLALGASIMELVLDQSTAPASRDETADKQLYPHPFE